MEHQFTPIILKILRKHFDDGSDKMFQQSELLQYINVKTRSASRGSKSRGAFGNLYALYVLVEDYYNNGYHEGGDYGEYEGAQFSDLLKRQRELPFGKKLQNHALNHRLNQEFRKYFPTCEFTPILRDTETKKYWINENFLKLIVGELTFNIAPAVIEIINAYIEAKKSAFERFVQDLRRLVDIQEHNPEEVSNFIKSLLDINVDARIFEIVSYAILKTYYSEQIIYWGWSLGTIQEEVLTLYKTGRTNANDGGIDFVMKPLGRFFQVTETVNVRKYFLDIDKIQHYPLTFVIKSVDTTGAILSKIRLQAEKLYPIESIVQKYMQCIEEVINIPRLLDIFDDIRGQGKLREITDEIIIQSNLEFHQDV